MILSKGKHVEGKGLQVYACESAYLNLEKNAVFGDGKGQPFFIVKVREMAFARGVGCVGRQGEAVGFWCSQDGVGCLLPPGGPAEQRSEEHTSELQSRPHLVCRLLLEN